MEYKITMPGDNEILPGRDTKVNVNPKHAVNSNSIVPPFPENMDNAIFGMGCFWGAERTFWPMTGIYSTHVGYCGGKTLNPTNEEVNTGNTAHAAVLRVVFDPNVLS